MAMGLVAGCAAALAAKSIPVMFRIIICAFLWRHWGLLFPGEKIDRTFFGGCRRNASPSF